MCIHVHIKKESTTTRVARFSEGMGSLCNKIILRLRLPWKIIVYPNAWDLKSSLGTAVQKPIPFTIVCGERSPINSKKKCYSFNASADMDVFPCCTPRGLRNFSSAYRASKDRISGLPFRATSSKSTCASLKFFKEQIHHWSCKVEHFAISLIPSRPAKRIYP